MTDGEESGGKGNTVRGDWQNCGEQVECGGRERVNVGRGSTGVVRVDKRRTL